MRPYGTGTSNGGQFIVGGASEISSGEPQSCPKYVLMRTSALCETPCRTVAVGVLLEATVSDKDKACGLRRYLDKSVITWSCY